MVKEIAYSISIFLLMVSCKQYSEKEMNELQISNDQQAVIEVVNSIFINTDARNWDEVESGFANKVELDYTSMVGGKPSSLTPQQIIESWKSILPGFESTHHQISNYVVKIENDAAELFCYGTASHYLPVEDGDPLWIVVGTYDFHLIKANNKWKVDKMKFNFKFQSGNTSLPETAQKRAR